MLSANTVVITPFNGDQATANAIADHHLSVRLQQQQNGENDFRTNIRDSQADLRAIGAFYVEPGGNFFVGRNTSTNEIAGFVGLRKIPGEVTIGEIKRLAVMSDFRRQGVGTMLVEALVSWARQNGYKTLRLSTGKDEKARPIYEKAGFIMTGFDEVHEDHLMTLDLTK